ncbi:hypothetical protein CVT26_003947 [Gymnopilus dilepis]|uniref:GED domain-containing protein n=1 Tax=Gymnopilus dilepis TaxID=231916 RepID=A0A409WTV4_9AGAR|nr:hypothetical protein CVT26_003947 [Gymnopilus dilepis]
MAANIEQNLLLPNGQAGLTTDMQLAYAQFKDAIASAYAFSEVDASCDHEVSPTAQSASPANASTTILIPTQSATKNRDPTKQPCLPAHVSIEIHRLRCLAGPLYPFLVQRKFISNSVNQWLPIALELCKKAYDSTMRHLCTAMEGLAADQSNPELMNIARSTVRTFVSARKQETETRLRWMSTLEQDISTLDKELFSLLKNKQAARYKEHRNRRPPSPCALTCHKDSTENVEEGTPRLTFRQTLSLRHLGMTSIQPQSESKAAFKPDNQFSSIIAAEIRAYLCIASHRFTDNVVLTIEHSLLQPVLKGVPRLLYDMSFNLVKNDAQT